MAYGAILGQSLENSPVLDNYFTKDETLSDATAALFGLGTDAVPDDVFEAIGGASGAGLIPVGTIIWFAKSTAPAGYLVCDGSSFSSSTYPALYAVLGETRLPYLINKFIKGGRTVGKEHDGTYIGVREHSGVFSLAEPGGQISIGSAYGRESGSGYDSYKIDAYYVQPPNVTMLPCIKY